MPLMNSDMVKDYLGVSRASISNYVVRKMLRPVFDGRPYVFTDDEVERFVREEWSQLRPAGGVAAVQRKRAGGKRRG